MINSFYRHQLLVAADQQRHGFLKIRGRAARNEICLMAEAGLVEATLSDGRNESFTVINRLTDSGREFLRAHQNCADDDVRGRGSRLAYQTAALEKVQSKFALNLPLPSAN